MNKISKIGAITIAAIGLTGCGDSDDPVKIQKETIILSRAEQDVVSSQHDYSIALLDAALAEGYADDVLFSPLAIEMAMNMTAHGMGSESLNEVLKAFEASDLGTLDSVNKTYLKKLPASDPDAVTVSMSFSNWQNSVYTFNPAFAASLKDLFDIPTMSVDFSKTDMMKSVNDWANKSTNGLIKKVLDKQPEPSVMMILCNSLYFNGKWKDPFDRSLTKPHDFKTWGGQSAGKVQLMQYPAKDGKLEYHEFDKYRVASIPYGDGLFKLNIYLPDADCTQAQLIEAMKSYKKDVSEDRYRRFTAPKVLIPRFEFESAMDLTSILNKTGINLAESDLSGIADNIKGVLVKQFSHIKVDEEGTEAAVIIEQVIDTMAPNPLMPGEDFIVDRPFAYSITGPYGAVLFIGIKSKP